ncbi:MAG: Stk1 family PASTA domain-containing Ser/Thr kinase [Actinomycetota bacterium]|nr:Stk1 family PASTA domain-containing Ser/Thr kinase [Actinomycetota bacterium]
MDTTLADPLIGRLLEGRYRIDRRIARGGMATVYHALDERLDRVVAVKVMHPGLAEDAHFLARFTAEAKSAARLSSAHVVSVFDQGSHDGLAFLVMELVQGRTLRDLLHERGRLSPAQALSVLEPVLLALSAAHRAGLVHRDVKPENVLLGDDGSVKVADFGLARAVEAATHTSAAGLLIGTAAYVAPEQVARGTADERTDVYAAGVLLFEMLTGTVPFVGETAVSVAYQHVHGDVPPPSTRADVPPALDALTVRATRRDPGARPSDAGAFLAELRDVREDLGLRLVAVPSGPASTAPSHATVAVPLLDRAEPPPQGRRRRRPGRVPVTLVVILLLGAIMAGTGWWLGTGRFTEAPSLYKLTKVDALKAAKAKGLTLRYGDKAYSELVPVDSVVSQDPVAGRRIRKGTAVTVVLSLGKERHAVPDLKGDAQQEAVAKLTAAHLTPQVLTKADDKVPVGRVLSQSLKPGLMVRPATTVLIVVSSGPPPVPVPSVVGDDVTDAKSKLAAAGFTVTVKRVNNVTIPKDEVISQSPASGNAPRGSAVQLTVSDGPPLITVPNVVGMKIHDAERKLTEAGFKVRVVSFLFTDRVKSQSPGGGQKAPKGSTINLLR